MPLDEDAPMELLWKDLRQSPLWGTVERRLLDKRDKMVKQMVAEETLMPKTLRDARTGSVAIAAEDPMVIFARLQFKLGYIAAINAIVAEPEIAEKKAAQAARETT